MPNPERATSYTEGVNYFVPNMQLHSDVTTPGLARPFIINSVPALSATAILNAQSIATAGSATAFAAGYSKDNMGDYGRAVQIVLSGAGTPTVDVRGRDYLGQPMRETLTGAGTTPVIGKKAFKYIDTITWTAVAATTMNVGTTDILGLPFCSDALVQENVNDAVPANAGTFVAAVKTDPATATTGDPRGTYAPHTNNATNGSRTYRLVTQCDKSKLHGIKQYYA
jgi:hypothetical protein